MTKANSTFRTINKTSTLVALILFFFGLSHCFAQEEFHTNSTPPVYSEGISALHRFIKDNICYPETVEKEAVSGIVTVSYVINQQGNVENVKLVRGIDPAYDTEAIRVTKMITGWQPALQWGRPVEAKMLMQIEFNSDTEKQFAQPTVLTGKISDITNGKPIEGALVVITGTSVGTMTDKDGIYRLEVKDRNINLEIIAVGYETAKLESGGNQLINIELLPAYYIIDFGLNIIRNND